MRCSILPRLLRNGDKGHIPLKSMGTLMTFMRSFLSYLHVWSQICGDRGPYNQSDLEHSWFYCINCFHFSAPVAHCRCLLRKVWITSTKENWEKTLLITATVQIISIFQSSILHLTGECVFLIKWHFIISLLISAATVTPPSWLSQTAMTHLSWSKYLQYYIWWHEASAYLYGEHRPLEMTSTIQLLLHNLWTAPLKWCIFKICFEIKSPIKIAEDQCFHIKFMEI